MKKVLLISSALLCIACEDSSTSPSPTSSSSNSQTQGSASSSSSVSSSSIAVQTPTLQGSWVLLDSIPTEDPTLKILPKDTMNFQANLGTRHTIIADQSDLVLANYTMNFKYTLSKDSLRIYEINFTSETPSGSNKEETLKYQLKADTLTLIDSDNHPLRYFKLK